MPLTSPPTRNFPASPPEFRLCLPCAGSRPVQDPALAAPSSEGLLEQRVEVQVRVH